MRTKVSVLASTALVDGEGRLIGVTTRKRLHEQGLSNPMQPEITMGDIATRNPATAEPDEPLRAVVHRMVETGFTRFPVVDDEGKLIGMVALEDMLSARVRSLGEERNRDRPLRLRLLFKAGKSSAS